ncbi:MAG TPA: S8 family serine peptidase, partial [Candidatus Limnocylindrales bacterium]|nr:S8 family serine peptidase [Candidatus Limnocylindrales bacterium]
HADVDPASTELRSRVAAAARVDEGQIETGLHKYRLEVADEYLPDLAAIDDVRQIQEVIETGLSNNVAGPIIGGTVVINGTPFEGDGEVIAVADTGFDMGSTTNVHAAFTNRVLALYDLGRPNMTNDPDGHGTHVAGSAVGDGNSTSMGGAIRGTAPQARLVVQSLLDSAGGLNGIPADLHDLFRPPYDNDGARVHTNSWNTMRAGVAYDTRASEIDDFVWTHQDMVILYCAGNYGTDSDDNGVVEDSQVGAEAAAKNAITVGACESNRGSATWKWGTYIDNRRPSVKFKADPVKSDQVCNDADGMAGFSSRGPTQEQRFKPDVVAPGTCILSTRSRALTSVATDWGTSSDNGYFFDAGTSMATPLTAGCAAVLRETLVKNGWASPPAAVIKALLINGAVELTGQYNPTEAGTSPNNHSGWGRVDLAGSVIIPGPAGDAGVGTGGPLKESGQEESFHVHVPGSTFKITLVWTDPAGAALQNDLDLIVRASNGEERHGNMGTAKEGFDRVNNVEQVLWEHVPSGDLEVIIRAFRISQFAQPYAYAWRLTSS